MASRSVDSFIRLVRGQRVILDKDLARVYGVTTARLNQQVKRNIERFPLDFVFQLTATESAALMLQFATSNKGRGGRRKLPNAFTEHGAIMAASMLNSRTAVHMSVFVVRAFVKMREALAQNSQLAAKLAELERRLTDRLDVHEKAIVHILDEIRELMAPPPQPVPERRQIGFHVRDEAANASSLARRPPLKRRSKGAGPAPLYKAKPLGRSRDRRSAVHHDVILYGR
jgi:phage regulator Rha-like protein